MGKQTRSQKDKQTTSPQEPLPLESGSGSPMLISCIYMYTSCKSACSTYFKCLYNEVAPPPLSKCMVKINFVPFVLFIKITFDS